MTEWFESWFGEEYLRLYPHRDEDDARRAIAMVGKLVNLTDTRVLDLACGPGRHAIRLAQAGARVVGLDLSMPLLSRARNGAPPVDHLVRADMRILPFQAGSFDVIVNLFTSFGYFVDDRQHAQVLNEARRLVTDNGVMIMDYLNADQVRSTLVPHEVRRVGSQQVIVERRISADGLYVEKEMHLKSENRTFAERVRLFDINDLTALFERAGFTIVQRLGDYDHRPWSPACPRTILLARAK